MRVLDDEGSTSFAGRANDRAASAKLMIAPLYFFLERVLMWIHNGSAALIQGLSLGLLSNEQLERLTEHRYLRQSAGYSDESYVDSGLFLWEREAIRRYFPPGGRILVAAAGAGREMIALAKCGFLVKGFDCCAPLVESGRNQLKQHGIDANLDYAPPSTVPESGGDYDAVLVGFSGYMYIPGRVRRIRFLRDLSAFLSPGAPVMVSFAEGSSGRRRAWTARIGSAIRTLRRAEPVEEGDWLKDGFQHHFDRQQVASELNEAGIDLVYYGGGTCYGHAVGLVRTRM
ncbi:MAG: class I SAM-dependent methyltransferase [Candidatus Binataceae bacterium]